MTNILFICKLCNYKATKLTYLTKHINYYHKISYQTYFDTYIEPDDLHLCPICLNKRKFFKGKYRKTCGNPECNYIQRKKTCEERYGVSNISLIPEVQEKKIQTCLKHFDVKYPMQSNVVINKVKETNQKLYNTDWALASKEYRNNFIIPGCINSLGYENPMNSKDIQRKCYETNIKNHNGLYSTQTKEWIKKYAHGSNKQYSYKNLILKSKAEYELAVWLDNNNIKYIYEPCQFKYKDLYNKEHTYTPDFLINNKLYEIKGDIFLDENDNLINYFNNDLTYIQTAKQECMKEHNVILLKTSILKNLLETNKLLEYFII